MFYDKLKFLKYFFLIEFLSYLSLQIQLPGLVPSVLFFLWSASEHVKHLSAPESEQVKQVL
jgi:hypothetical protein